MSSGTVPRRRRRISRRRWLCWITTAARPRGRWSRRWPSQVGTYFQRFCVFDGLTNAVAQTYPTAKTGTGSGTSDAQPTGTATSDGTSGGAGTSSSRPGIGIIIGGVIALVGAISIAGLVAFLIYRRRKKTKLPLASTIGPPDATGKPELGGTMLTELPPKSPSMTVSQVSSPRPDTISPASAYGGGGFGQSPMGAELPGQGHTPPVPEMPANTNGQLQPGGQYMPPELQSHGGYGNQYGQSLPLPPELQGGGYAQPQGQTTPIEAHGQPVHQAFGAQQASYQVADQQRNDLQGMVWHSGPTPGYSELDSGHQRR